MSNNTPPSIIPAPIPPQQFIISPPIIPLIIPPPIINAIKTQLIYAITPITAKTTTIELTIFLPAVIHYPCSFENGNAQPKPHVPACY